MSVERRDDEVLDRLAGELNTELARALASLSYMGATPKGDDVEDGMLSRVPLDVVPLDAGYTRLRVAGRDGLVAADGGPIEMVCHEGTVSPAVGDVVRDLLGRFPPTRDGGTALFLRGGDVVAAVAPYASKEIGASYYVLWTDGNVRAFAWGGVS